MIELRAQHREDAELTSAVDRVLSELWLMERLEQTGR